MNIKKDLINQLISVADKPVWLFKKSMYLGGAKKKLSDNISGLIARIKKARENEK